MQQVPKIQVQSNLDIVVRITEDIRFPLMVFEEIDCEIVLDRNNQLSFFLCTMSDTIFDIARQIFF